MTAVWARRKWLGALVFTLMAASTVAIVLGLPDIYRAAATVLIEQPRTDTGAPGDLDTRLQMINQEVLSRSRLETLIRTYDLYPRLRPQASAEALAARMRRDIRTEFKSLPQGQGSTISFTLSYRGTNPRTAAQVTNALASFYVEQDAKIRERQTTGAVTVLSAQLEEMKRDVERQERAMSEYQEQHLGELPQHADANLAAMARLNADLRTAGEQKARALDRRDELMRRLVDTDAGATPAALGPAAARVARLKQELADLLQRYSEKHPDVIQKRSELVAAEQQERAPAPAATAPAARPAARLDDALARIEDEIRSYAAQEARLRGEVAGYAQRLENVPLRQRALQDISRDYETTRDLYDSVRKRYELAQLESGVQAQPSAPRFRILDPAVPPTDPVAPNRLVLMLVALAASLALALAAAALAEKLDSSFHSTDDVTAYTRVPVLASIPLIVTAGDRRRRRMRVGLAAAAILLAMTAMVHTVHRLARGQESLVAMLARS